MSTKFPDPRSEPHEECARMIAELEAAERDHESHRRQLQARNTELVEENRRLRALLVGVVRLIAAAPELLSTLEAIAKADPREWDEEFRGQFREWAQSLARAAILRATRGAP